MVCYPSELALYNGPSIGPAPYTEPGLSAWTPRPDDGVFLVYRVPGYFRPRTETVCYSTTYGAGGVEHRHVTTRKSLLDFSALQSYDETAISGGFRLGGVVVGGEWSSQNGGRLPFLALDLEVIEVQLQPGQLMAGWANPFGLGGGRVNTEFRMGENVSIVTSYSTFSQANSPSAFGHEYVHPEAILSKGAIYVSGVFTQYGWISGIDRLRLMLSGLSVKVVS